MAGKQNIIGAQIRRLRYAQGLTQEMLAARCGLLGLDMSRGTLSKIEAQIRCISDSELQIIAEALKVPLEKLFPPRKQPRK